MIQFVARSITGMQKLKEASGTSQMKQITQSDQVPNLFPSFPLAGQRLWTQAVAKSIIGTQKRKAANGLFPRKKMTMLDPRQSLVLSFHLAGQSLLTQAVGRSITCMNRQERPPGKSAVIPVMNKR
jgi:hypothetical protein